MRKIFRVIALIFSILAFILILHVVLVFTFDAVPVYKNIPTRIMKYSRIKSADEFRSKMENILYAEDEENKAETAKLAHKFYETIIDYAYRKSSSIKSEKESPEESLIPGLYYITTSNVEISYGRDSVKITNKYGGTSYGRLKNENLSYTVNKGKEYSDFIWGEYEADLEFGGGISSMRIYLDLNQIVVKIDGGRIHYMTIFNGKFYDLPILLGQLKKDIVNECTTSYALKAMSYLGCSNKTGMKVFCKEYLVTDPDNFDEINKQYEYYKNPSIIKFEDTRRITFKSNDNQIGIEIIGSSLYIIRLPNWEAYILDDNTSLSENKYELRRKSSIYWDQHQYYCIGNIKLNGHDGENLQFTIELPEAEEMEDTIKNLCSDGIMNEEEIKDLLEKLPGTYTSTFEKHIQQ